MDKVFVVHHVHLLPEGTEDIKLIGVYRTRASAERAVERLAMQPGFSAHPGVVDAQRTDDSQGFHISAYVLDKDHWVEGFVTI
jgi:hypothetical protein